MRISHAPAALAATALIGALALLLLAGGSDASAGKTKTKTIEMIGKKEKDLAFDGPKSVEAGATLRIENSTDVRKVGPHTFTLVKPSLLPRSEKEGKACFDPGNLCDDVAVAHEVDFESGAVGKAQVEEGKKGWDTEFTKKAYGDSGYTELNGEKFSRKVTAKAGDSLGYFCVIHPWMQGEIKVK